MQIQLSDHFSFSRIIRFAIPSVIMMIFTSIYSVVDGFFVSNFVGETEFAAVNFIMPFIMLQDCVGFMLSNGGAALIAFLLGKQDRKKANEVFSLLVYVALILGVVLGAITEIVVRPAAVLLGGEGELLEACVLYSRVILITSPAFMLQYTFQSFFIAAEKPRLGLAFTLAAGLSNMVLDWLFMAVFGWGVAGAAAASCIGQMIGGFGPLIYFGLPNKSLLRLGKTHFDWKSITKTCSNGIAELVTNASMSLVNMIYNIQLLKLAGEYGVAAYGIIMYVNFVFLCTYIGYTIGVAPIVSYNYGAGTHEELKNVTKKSLTIITVCSVTIFLISQIFARPLAMIFAGYDDVFLEISVRAIKLYSMNYIFAGINLFTSGFFAALNNGKVSFFLSVLRMLVFQLSCVLIIPIFLGTDGVWISMPIAELGTIFFSIWMLIRNRSKYNY